MQNGGVVQSSSIKDQSQVDRQLEMLSGQIDRAINLQGETENRIISIVRPDVPCPETAKDCVEQGLVPLADTLRTLAKKLAMVNDRTESMKNRTEL